MNRGFVILAQNTDKIDYVKCAEALAISIKKSMPNESVTLISDNNSDCAAFDKIIKLPYGDLAPDSDWKLVNDWQVYDASPYEYTIKLEADLYIPNDISHWFNVLSINDVVVCTKIRNYKQELSNIRFYRRFIDDNLLPDTYNAITFFKKTELAKQFFLIVKDVFENWEEYKSILKCNPNEVATTDWAYALASHILGVEKTTLPNFDQLSMIHMKQFINDCINEDWTDRLIYELLPETIRINTVPQLYPLHYINKTFSNKLLENYKWKN